MVVKSRLLRLIRQTANSWLWGERSPPTISPSLMGHIYTISGRKVDYLNPEPGCTCAFDIAYALSRIPRFVGHTRYFYSVAQHCVILSEYVSPEAAPWALIHDADEAYMGDMPGPLKHIPEVAAVIKPIENILTMRILADLGMGLPSPEIIAEVDEADKRLVVNEVLALRDPVVIPTPTKTPLPLDVRPVDSSEAYYLWRKRFQTLFPDATFYGPEVSPLTPERRLTSSIH